MMGHLLRAAFYLAMRRNPPLVHRNPLGKQGAVDLPKVSKTKIKPLTHAQAMALLDRAKDHPHEHVYWPPPATGLRVGEALACSGQMSTGRASG